MSECSECRKWEEREAACCPEDWAFDDYIKVLRQNVAALEAFVTITPDDRLLAGIRKALTFYQTTHIHAILEQTLRDVSELQRFGARRG